MGYSYTSEDLKRVERLKARERKESKKRYGDNQILLVIDNKFPEWGVFNVKTGRGKGPFKSLKKAKEFALIWR